MQRTDSLTCLMTLQQAVDRWFATAPPNTEIAQQIRTTIKDLDFGIANLQTQIQRERIARKQAETPVPQPSRIPLHDCQKAEVALQESEARYRRIIETATEGIWILDVEGRTSFANGRLARMLGYEVPELIDRPFLNFVHSGSRALAEKCFDRLRCGIQEQHDLRFCGNEGQEIWAIVSATSIQNAAGQFNGILIMMTDITERKHARTKLEHSLCLLQTTLESTVDGILAIDIFGNILNMNRHFLEQWDLPENALSYGNVEELMPYMIACLTDAEQLRQQLQLEYDQPLLTSKMLLEHYDGRVFERHSKPLRLGDSIIGRVISIRDITEQKRAEAALEESEALLRTVVTNTPTILYAIDREGIFTLFEGKGLENAAFKPGELVGQSVFEVYGHYPKVLTDLQRVLGGAEHRDVMVIDDIPYDNQATPVRNAQGEVTGLIGIAIDISARLQAEVALREAKADLEQRVEERTAELSSTNAQLQQEIAQREQIEKSLRESQVCLRLINSISAGITAGLSVEQLIASTIDHTSNYFSHLRVLYSIVEDDQVRVLYSAQPETMIALSGFVETYKGASERLNTFARLQPVKIDDILQEPLLEPFRDRYASRQTRAILSVPVQHSVKQIGLLSFHAPEPHNWSAYEVATLTELADYLSIVLQKVQAQQERQQAEERLRLFESVVINGNDAVMITNADLDHAKISYVNEAFTIITGHLPEEMIGQTPRILQGPKTDRAQLNRIRTMLLQGKPVQAELINYRKDGSEFWVDLNIVPIKDRQGNLTNFVALQRDITDRKWSEKALIATQTRLKYLLSSNPSVIYTCHPNRNRACTFVSENITQQLGYEIWQYLKEPHFWVDHVHPEDLPNVLSYVTQLFTDGELTCEYRFLHQDGQYRWLRDSMKLSRDRQGQPLEIIGSVVDITERKWAEDQIRTSLTEKEVMLKEIHHRVKNNLQVISSLLKLQAGYLKDQRILEIFKESQNRVRAMALIHEKLYQSEDLAKTDFGEYIRSLINDLFRSYSVNSRLIRLELQVEEVRLNIDTAIPCGLIINELVSNALKHAFPTGQAGTLRVDLRAQPDDNRYHLVVHDNGIGFPEDLDFRHTASLGLQLVYSLTNQLQGTIDLIRQPGSTFTITFSELKPKG
jgi:PAS domain S-box-containing protein